MEIGRENSLQFNESLRRVIIFSTANSLTLVICMALNQSHLLNSISKYPFNSHDKYSLG